VVVRAHRARRRPEPTLPIVLAGAYALQNLAKLLSDRPRPPVGHLEHVTSSSFPSGHATQISAVVAALLLGRRLPGRRGALFAAGVIAVTAVAASRVYLGVHYPTDVIAGALLGTTWGVIAAGRVTASPGPDGAQPRIPVCPSE
jgi:undecaprenyl-diphosphatase